MLVLVAVACCAPGWLFFCPTEPVVLNPISDYRLKSDDFAYIGGSRNWSRVTENLFLPHNAHIVPSWRITTWALVRAAGSISRVPDVFAIAAYGMLVTVILLTGRLIARETNCWTPALASMIGVGTTSVMWMPTIWYSAGQTLWAGAGILIALGIAQDYRRWGGVWRLPVLAAAVMIAGGFWTIGHAAGPVSAVYLWCDGRSRCRWAAVAPVVATVVMAGGCLALGASKMDVTISFHGRTVEQALDPWRGVTHTLQAIPENLVFGNLGLSPETTAGQGIALTAGLLLIWAWSRRSTRWIEGEPEGMGRARKRWWRAISTLPWPRPRPLEAAGGLLVLSAYLVEWSFRSYLPWSSLRLIVPWYDAIPQIGFILFLSGWWTALAGIGVERGPLPRRQPIRRPSRGAAWGLVALLVTLVMLNTPRVEAQLYTVVPNLTDEEKLIFRIPELTKMRALYLADLRAAWQRRHLQRFEQAETRARKLGIGWKQIREVFGRVELPEIPKVYDAVLMLDLPPDGVVSDPQIIRQELARGFTLEPEPRPDFFREFGMSRPSPSAKAPEVPEGL